MSDLVTQIRKIASRGRMDDADVQIIFDAADEILGLRAELANYAGYVYFLLDHGYSWGEEGTFCFPTGDIFRRDRS